MLPSKCLFFSKNLSAAKMFAPELIPTNNPLCANFLAIHFASSVVIVIISSTSSPSYSVVNTDSKTFRDTTLSTSKRICGLFVVD